MNEETTTISEKLQLVLVARVSNANAHNLYAFVKSVL
jgi:hypothetical protein